MWNCSVQQNYRMDEVGRHLQRPSCLAPLTKQGPQQCLDDLLVAPRRKIPQSLRATGFGHPHSESAFLDVQRTRLFVKKPNQSLFFCLPWVLSLKRHQLSLLCTLPSSTNSHQPGRTVPAPSASLCMSYASVLQPSLWLCVGFALICPCFSSAEEPTCRQSSPDTSHLCSVKDNDHLFAPAGDTPPIAAQDTINLCCIMFCLVSIQIGHILEMKYLKLLKLSKINAHKWETQIYKSLCNSAGKNLKHWTHCKAVWRGVMLTHTEKHAVQISKRSLRHLGLHISTTTSQCTMPLIP